LVLYGQVRSLRISRTKRMILIRQMKMLHLTTMVEEILALLGRHAASVRCFKRSFIVLTTLTKAQQFDYNGIDVLNWVPTKVT